MYTSSQTTTHDMLELSLRSHSQDGGMDNALGTEDRGELNLLLVTSQTIRQIAEIARTTKINEEEGIFYSHLRFHCMRFQDCLMSAPQTWPRFKRDSVNDALYHLSSLIHETGPQELASSMTPKVRLKALNLNWSDMRTQANNAKVAFVEQWLRLGSPEEHLKRVDKGLGECADLLEKQQPENPFKKSPHEFLSTGNYEPSYVIWKAAQSLFDALQSCKSCSCSKQHDFGAKLELGTYRRPVKKVGNSSTTRSHPSLMRPSDGEATGKLDFGMFLSMEHDWHEFRVQTVKERVVGFAMDGHAALSREAHKPKRLVNLCKSINSTRSKASQRLVLKLTSGQLFNEKIEKSNFWIDKSTEPISLSRCFEERHEFFTEKTKRILSLLIGYAALHLNGTSWLQLGWGSANIKFFQTIAHKTPLRPFIQVDLPEVGATTDIEPDSNDDDETCFEEFDSGHRCPALIALAVVLIEVYFAKPFNKLAQMSGIPLENPDGHITLLDVDQVFNGEEENKVEGWRSQIPEDSPLLMAIDNCLNPEMWEDEEGDSLDNATLKSRIYQEVVRLLELHLTSGFSKIPLDNVDSYARELDFGQWGQPIDYHEPQIFISTLSQESLTPQRTPSPATSTLESSLFGVQMGLPEMPKLLHQYSQANSFASFSSSSMKLSSQSDDADYRAPQFFDDEVCDGGHSVAKTNSYLKWRSEYEKVYEKFISAYLPARPLRPAKVAILDTGIDRNHDVFEAREENIKAKLNFYNNTQRSIPDLNGHGTFTASLILDYAPDAELYIAKIADKKNAIPDPKVIADAINHAVDKWDVDIISLSFGWPSARFEGNDALQDAIDKAYDKKILMFAAASNSGGRHGRAYPASSPHVICVHSTDTLGNRSPFSPTYQPYNLNLATVGEAVLSAWPTSLCDDKEASQGYASSRSGTSYATPIMAGIAAFLLQYASLHLRADKAMKLKSKANMEALLRRCAERGRNYSPRDHYHYVELSLYDDNLFGKQADGINEEILKILDG